MTRKDYIKMADLYLDVVSLFGPKTTNRKVVKAIILIKFLEVLETYPDFNHSKFESYVYDRSIELYNNLT
ncbi:hypothetical protein LCGC14_2900760 [marine sediment metagenome]|uniref:Uncharacterized protein n=1 Tax=marine sediment metagenome TaxID=412755 RepID=A0A0F8YGC8_9ZZZZ